MQYFTEITNRRCSKATRGIIQDYDKFETKDPNCAATIAPHSPVSFNAFVYVCGCEHYVQFCRKMAYANSVKWLIRR